MKLFSDGWVSLLVHSTGKEKAKILLVSSTNQQQMSFPVTYDEMLEIAARLTAAAQMMRKDEAPKVSLIAP